MKNICVCVCVYIHMLFKVISSLVKECRRADDKEQMEEVKQRHGAMQRQMVGYVDTSMDSVNEGGMDASLALSLSP